MEKKELREERSLMEEMREVCVPQARDAPHPRQCSPVHADVRKSYLTITCGKCNFVTVVLLRERWSPSEQEDVGQDTN